MLALMQSEIRQGSARLDHAVLTKLTAREIMSTGHQTGHTVKDTMGAKHGLLGNLEEGFFLSRVVKRCLSWGYYCYNETL